VADGQGLGDHPAERPADHVRGLPAQRVQHRHGILCHVLQPVGRAGAVADEQP
jgi:hypothetical protein